MNHECKLKITRQIDIPRYEHGGVELELRAGGKHLANLVFSGAHVHFQRHRKQHHWSFSQFVSLLEKADKLP